MKFSLFQGIRILILTEMLPDEGDYLGLHYRFPVSPFHPSGNSVVPVVLMIHMSLNHLGAHPHVQTLVERLNHSIWQGYSLRYPSVYTCLVCGVVVSVQLSQFPLNSRRLSLPPHRISSMCKHSDILNNILVSCSDLTFQ